MNQLRRTQTARRAAGFTIIELLAVMAVLGILVMAAMPLAEISVQRDRERELKRALWEIRDAIDSYKKAAEAGNVALVPDSAGFPASLAALVDGATHPKKEGSTQFFLRRVPRDPFADPDIPAEKTWGLRSYQSSASQPKPGSDVYDVYSRSDKVGLNGIALRDW